MYGLYYDEGIAGTKKEVRPALMRMMTDCEAGKFDRIVTKSLSRFARNTTDCLELVRGLKDIGVSVFFEKENIETMNSKGDIMLTIMASLAQNESQSLSQNVRLGLRFRYQDGKVQVCTNRFLGYDRDEEGKLVINPQEAEVVKRIYREFLEGKSYYAIGQGLTADGIKTAAGSERWLASTLRKILMNEKYMGDALLQKTITTDFLTKKRVANKGIVYCAHCGDIYQRTQWLLKGEHVPVWRCVSRLLKRKNSINCPSRKCGALTERGNAICHR